MGRPLRENRAKSAERLLTSLMQYTTALVLGILVAIALATCTFFQPDEYFQAVGLAHFLVFGYSN